MASHKHLDNLILNTNKAGMQGLDAEKVNEIIQKASEGSRFYKHKLQAQQRLDAKIEHMLQIAKKYTSEELLAANTEMENVAIRCDGERDLSRTIVHVDMDMFFAAVEMRDDPALKNVPMAVGSSSMLSTSNYEARRYGVRAAMPGFIALKLCPQLVLVPPNFKKYKAASKVVEEIFAFYDPNYVMMSLDEAYLDITQYIDANKDNYKFSEENGSTCSEVIVKEMRQKIFEATSLTASAGIAPNTRLAKVCSDLNKPNGQYFLPPDSLEIRKFMETLPIRKICGIGNVMEQQLKALGIVTCGDLAPQFGLLKLLFSETNVSYFVRISLGLGETDLANMASGERKSISNESTFSGTADREELLCSLAELCRDLQRDMVKRSLLGKVLTVKMKTIDFSLRTRAVSLGEPTCDLDVMLALSRRILLSEMDKCPAEQPLSLRLLGVRMSTLCESKQGTSKQTTLTCLLGAKDKSDIAGVEAENKCHKDSGGSTSQCSVSYTCPVCNMKVQTKFLNTFNKHVDECLARASVGQESHVSTVNKTDECFAVNNQLGNLPSNKNISPSKSENKMQLDFTAVQTTSRSFFKAYSSTKNSSNRCRDTETNSEHQDNSESFSLAKVSCEDSTKRENSEYSFGKASATLVCPVCSSASFSCGVKLNRHLDECLVASQKLNSSAPPPTKKRRKFHSVKSSRAAPTPSIVNFFATR